MTLNDIAQELARVGKQQAHAQPLRVQRGMMTWEQHDHRLECMRLAFLLVNALAHHPEALEALDATPEGKAALKRIERPML